MKKILFALMCVTALAILTGCGNKEELEAKAVPLVNKMLERELGERVKANGNTLVKCTKVDLTQKIAPRQEGTVSWEGKVTLENGRKIDCIVTDLGNDKILVEVELNSVN